MPTWNNTRLAVLIDGDADNPVSPIESFSPSMNKNVETVHSLEATHIGYISNPESFTFNMSVKAIDGSSAQLMSLAMNGTEFDIGLFEAAGSTGEWDFAHIVLRKCLITSASPSNATVSGAPMSTFSGVCREFESHASGDAGITLPTFTG